MFEAIGIAVVAGFAVLVAVGVGASVWRGYIDRRDARDERSAIQAYDQAVDELHAAALQEWLLYAQTGDEDYLKAAQSLAFDADWDLAS